MHFSTLAATAALVAVASADTTSLNTSPATVLTHDGTTETIWWVPSTTGSWWTPTWWSDYTAAGGKLASDINTWSTTVLSYVTTKDGLTFTTSTTYSSSSGSSTTTFPGTTTTGTPFTTKDSKGSSTTITPTVDIFTTTDKSGHETTTTSTISSSTNGAHKAGPILDMSRMGPVAVVGGLFGLGVSVLAL